MKTIRYIALLFTGALLAVTACYEIEPYEPDPDTIFQPGERIEPRTEKDIVLDQDLYLPLGAVVAMNLEHFDSPSSQLGMDTDTNGTDIIRYELQDTAIFVFQPDLNPDYLINFWDEDMNTLYFSLHNDTEPVSVKLSPGKYVMELISQIPYGIDTAGVQVIFIQPDLELSQQKADGTGYWYMTSRSMECIKCDLAGIDLSETYLAGADFEDADFSEAVLDSADLQQINALRTDFQDASLENALVRGGNYSFARFKGSDLRSADFRFAILNAADLTDARAYGANFCFATKNGWIIEGVLADSTTQCFP